MDSQNVLISKKYVVQRYCTCLQNGCVAKNLDNRMPLNLMIEPLNNKAGNLLTWEGKMCVSDLDC